MNFTKQVLQEEVAVERNSSENVCDMSMIACAVACRKHFICNGFFGKDGQFRQYHVVEALQAMCKIYTDSGIITTPVETITVAIPTKLTLFSTLHHFATTCHFDNTWAHTMFSLVSPKMYYNAVINNWLPETHAECAMQTWHTLELAASVFYAVYVADTVDEDKLAQIARVVRGNKALSVAYNIGRTYHGLGEAITVHDE